MNRILKRYKSDINNEMTEDNFNTILRICEIYKISLVHILYRFLFFQLLDTCMKRCGPLFHAEVGKFRFLNEMIKLVSPKYLGNRTTASVRQKVLQLLYAWIKEYPRESKIKEAYEMLKKQGVIEVIFL